MNGTRTSLITSLLVIALVSLHSPSANAYVVLKTWSGKNKHWTDSSVKWSIDSTVPMPGLTDDQFEDALGAAFDAWEAVSCGTIMFSGQGFSNPAGAIRTMVNTNSWDPTVGDALAYTVNDNDKDGIISSAEIVFNAVEAEWTVSTSAPPGMNDVQGVMTHEVGHAIGLDHSRHLEATMFFSGGSSHLRTLEPDDKRGLCYLYPAVPFEDGQP